jgi:hypothetical protein
MKHPCSIKFRVIVLTLTALFLLSCSYAKRVQHHFKDQCKNHAYARMVIEDYISRRFDSKAPVRMGIIPYSVPANFASLGSETPGLDIQLASAVQQKIMGTGAIPIVELNNRIEWPAKKDDFFAGNHGALAFARQANYDLVLVGYVPTTDNLQEMKAFTKVIEVDSGITVYYGQSILTSSSPDFQREEPWWWFGKKMPAKLDMQYMINELSHCIVQDVLSDEPAPN